MKPVHAGDRKNDRRPKCKRSKTSTAGSAQAKLRSKEGDPGWRGSRTDDEKPKQAMLCASSDRPSAVKSKARSKKPVQVMPKTKKLGSGCEGLLGNMKKPICRKSRAEAAKPILATDLNNSRGPEIA